LADFEVGDCYRVTADDRLWAYDKALDSPSDAFVQILSGLIASFGQQQLSRAGQSGLLAQWPNPQ
jgi:hypothetical protein